MKFLKRIIGCTLALCFVFAGVQPALAASYTITKGHVDYTYLSVASGTASEKQMTVAQVSSGDYAGVPAYCLEFHQNMAASGSSLDSGNLYSYLNDNLSEIAAFGVRAASIYGYPNYNNGVDNETANYIATQMIIWEYALGYRVSSDGDNPTAGLTGSLSSRESSDQTKLRAQLGNSGFDIRQRFWIYTAQKYYEIGVAYRAILNNIKNHTTLPSFSGSTVKLTWSAAAQRYEATITDTNNVLNSGWYWSPSCDNSSVGFACSGGNMTIYSYSQVSNVNITMTKKLPEYFHAVMTLELSGKQTMLVGTVAPGSKAVTLTVTIPTGSLRLTKVNKDNTGQKLSGAVFNVYYDSNANGVYNTTDTAKGSMTESSGVYTMSNLPVGTYFVKETKAPSGFVADSSTYTVRVTEGGTTTVANNGSLFANTPNSPDIPFLKVNEAGSIISGAKLVLYDSSGKQIDAWTSGSAAHIISTLKVGSTYRLHESSAPDGYLPAADITFTVTLKSGNNVVTIGGKAASSVTMTDEYLYVLPNAGGNGTTAYVLSGLGLIAVSSLLYTKRKAK